MNGLWLAALIVVLFGVTNWLQKVVAGLVGLGQAQTELIKAAKEAQHKQLEARVATEFLVTFLALLLFSACFLLSALGLIGSLCFAVSRYVL